MMFVSKLTGLFSVVPTTVLLTVSFFVLVVMRKIEESFLKNFGRLIVFLLWVSATLTFSTGVYTMITGRHLKMGLMEHIKKVPPVCMEKPGMMKRHMSSMTCESGGNAMTKTETEELHPEQK
jgi:hypothetical protein